MAISHLPVVLKQKRIMKCHMLKVPRPIHKAGFSFVYIYCAGWKAKVFALQDLERYFLNIHKVYCFCKKRESKLTEAVQLSHFLPRNAGSKIWEKLFNSLHANQVVALLHPQLENSLWARRELNPHDVAIAGFWVPYVCQFRHSPEYSQCTQVFLKNQFCPLQVLC